mmetsp:Transcript_10240/g.38797  ORF Transcript_10240/g.38797 Transcript_10240/m.38797 type:complete len:201 (+) Transcript_10240:785-1387(+)
MASDESPRHRVGRAWASRESTRPRTSGAWEAWRSACWCISRRSVPRVPGRPWRCHTGSRPGTRSQLQASTSQPSCCTWRRRGPWTRCCTPPWPCTARRCASASASPNQRASALKTQRSEWRRSMTYSVTASRTGQPLGRPRNPLRRWISRACSRTSAKGGRTATRSQRRENPRRAGHSIGSDAPPPKRKREGEREREIVH